MARKQRSRAEITRDIDAHREKQRRVDGSLVNPRPSEVERMARRTDVRTMHAAGMPTALILDAMRERYPMTEEAVLLLLREIRNDLQRELEVFAPQNQAAARERLYLQITNLNAELQTLRNNPKKDLAAIRAHVAEIRQFERLLAQMEGTLKPIKVEHLHGMTETMSRAIGSMTDAQIEQAIREEEEKRKQLEAGSINTSGEELSQRPRTRVSKNALPAKPPLAGAGRRPLSPEEAPDRVDRTSPPRPPTPGGQAPVRDREQPELGARSHRGVSGARVVG